MFRDDRIGRGRANLQLTTHESTQARATPHEPSYVDSVREKLLRRWAIGDFVLSKAGSIVASIARSKEPAPGTLKQWHRRLRRGDFRNGVFSSPSIETLVEIGTDAARYLGSGMWNSPLALFGAAYELSVATATATATDERTVSFLAGLLDFLPRYPNATCSLVLPRSLLDDPLHPMSLRYSDVEWASQDALVEAMFVSELLNDIDCSISRIVSAHPCKSALAPLRRRVQEQHRDPGAWFSARFLSIGSTLDAIEAIKPNEPFLTEFDLKTDLDRLHEASCMPYLVADRSGTVSVEGRGQYRLMAGVADNLSIDQYIAMRLPNANAGKRVEREGLSPAGHGPIERA